MMSATADTPAKPRKRRSADAELKTMLNQWSKEHQRAEKEARAEAQARAERRAKRVRKPQEKRLKRADAGERHVSSPGRGSHLWRYHVSGTLDVQQWSAGVEYADLVRRVNGAKVASYGQLPAGGGDGSLSDATYRAIVRLRRADERLRQHGDLCFGIVHAVCVGDWSTSAFLREIGRRPAEGINILRDGLSELAKMWRLPAKRPRLDLA